MLQPSLTPIGNKPFNVNFNLTMILIRGILHLFLPIKKKLEANGFSNSNIFSMVPLRYISLGLLLRASIKLKVLITFKPSAISLK